MALFKRKVGGTRNVTRSLFGKKASTFTEANLSANTKAQLDNLKPKFDRSASSADKTYKQNSESAYETKSSKRRDRKDSKESKKNSRSAQSAKGRTEEFKSSAKSKSNDKKQKKQTSKEKRIEVLTKTFKNNKYFEEMLNKIGLTVDQFLELHVDTLFKISTKLKDILKRAKNDKVNQLLRKYAKTPTPSNLALLEKEFHKITNTTLRDAFAQYAKNMAKYIPMGIAVAVAASGLPDVT